MKRAFTLFLALAMVLTGFFPAAKAEDEFGMGSTQNNTYWNESLKIGCTLDENWYFFTKEEIAQVNNMTVEALEGNLAQMVKDGGSLMDMYAQNLETGATLNLMVERLSLVNSLAVTEKLYANASQETVKQTLEQMGIEEVEVTLNAMEFAGQEHQSVSITGTYSGVPVFETMVVVKSGRNMIVVTAFSLDEEEIQQTLACFFDSLD